MRSAILLSLASLAGVCLLSTGSGCGSSNSTSPGDGGTAAETSSGSSSGAGSDSGGSSGSSSGGLPVGDASNDTGDGAMPCTSVPAGKQVLATKTQSVFGVTSDNQVLVLDWAAGSLAAVPLAGGTPATTIGLVNSAQDYIGVAGTVVTLVQTVTQNGYGTLNVWTAANGMKKIGTATYASTPGGGLVDVSSDGKYVVYTDNATATTADIYVAGTDGSNPTKLVTGASVGADCVPSLYFAGDDVVMAYCTSQPDASTAQTATVAAVTGAPGWMTTQTFANGDAADFVSSKATSGGSYVAWVTSAGLQAEQIGGTTPTVIDAKGGNGFFNNAGTSLIYFDAAGDILTSPVATPAPAELVAGPVFGTLALSPDDNWLEFAKSQDSTTGLTDVNMVSTTASGADGGNAVTTLDSMTDGTNFGDPFTVDSTHAVFYSAVNTNNGTGTYNSIGLPPSGMPSKITTTGWVGFASSAAKVVYSDNWASAMGSYQGYADIHSADLSGSAAPTTVVTTADANFYLTSDKSTIVYSWHACSGANEGIYTVAAP